MIDKEVLASLIEDIDKCDRCVLFVTASGVSCTLTCDIDHKVDGVIKLFEHNEGNIKITLNSGHQEFCINPYWSEYDEEEDLYVFVTEDKGEINIGFLREE